MTLSFFLKNKEYANLMDRLIKDSATCVNTRIATDFCRIKSIKTLRKKNYLYVGNDRKKNKTIIYLTNNNVRKNGKKYFFDFF